MPSKKCSVVLKTGVSGVEDIKEMSCLKLMTQQFPSVSPYQI